jgi:hypothetical protein
VECRRAAIGHPKVLPGPLGPTEGVWANMKNGLGNVAVRDVTQLAGVVKNRLKSIQYRPELICVADTAPIAESGGTAAQVTSTHNRSAASISTSRRYRRRARHWPT